MPSSRLPLGEHSLPHKQIFMTAYHPNSSSSAMEKHDQNNKNNNQQQYQQQHQQSSQFIPPQQSSRAQEGGQTYGKYIAPDGTEHPVYQPQPQFQGTFQPAPPQFQNQTSRSIGYEPSHPQSEERSIAQRSPSPMQNGEQGYNARPTSSTPPPYQYDRKS